MLCGAIIGAGYFAEFHAEAWRRAPDAEIAAVADVDGERAAAFALRWGIARTYKSAEDLLQSERLGFVDIVTRPESHLALTQLIASHGVHVICQKPMAPDPRSCRAMVESCDRAGVRLLIHENWRWQPWYRELRRILDQGVLGTPFFVSFRMRTGDGRGPAPYAAQPYFREMERFLIHETAVHFLDTFRFLAGEIESVFCRTARLNPAILGEDCALVDLRFHSGALGHVDANRVSGPETPPIALGELRLEGNRGGARVACDGRLWVAEPGAEEVEHAVAELGAGYRGDSVRAFQQHAVECLRSGEACESEGSEYLRTVALVEACYRSAESGEPVEVL